jgi:hypothetical protein
MVLKNPRVVRLLTRREIVAYARNYFKARDRIGAVVDR